MPASQLTILAQILLPYPDQLSLDEYRLSTDTLDLNISNHTLTAQCTNCGAPATRIHGHYQRLLADLPCCGRQIHIHWTVRRFFCDSPSCPKITFTEQLPTFAHKYARKTKRLSDKLYRLGLEIGGEMGKRVSKNFDIFTSGDYLIRLIRLHPEQSPRTPKVLGIDDWAWRKRHTDGTILVDLERRCVIDLLPDRQPETIAQWLRSHTEVEIISRDRGQEYIEGINQGLPGVVQVADRFHLLRNQLEALQRMMAHHPGEIKAALKQLQATASATSISTVVPAQVIENPKSHRQVRFDEVKRLQAQGLKRREIARQVGLDRRTVGKYFSLNAPPSRNGMVGNISKATPYYSHLHKRLAEGCHNLTLLYDELRTMGFKGSYSSVFCAVHRLGAGNLKQSDPAPSSPPRFSPNQVAWVLFQEEDKLKEPYVSLRKALCDVSPIANQAKELVQAFRTRV
jgi:transposase